MTPIVQPLLDLQDIDALLRDLDKELLDIPVRRANEENRLGETREAHARAGEALKLSQVNVANIEGEIEQQRVHVTKLRQQQATLKTNREFAAMTAEINAAEAGIDALENRLLAHIEEVGAAKRRLADAAAALAAEQGIVNEAQKELDDRMAEAQAARAELDGRRAEAAKACEPRMLATYNRLLRGRWRPVVPLENNAICNGCHLTQPPSVAHLVRRNQNPVCCQMCGRILYII
ncbi:MAG: hypothetical protein FWF96_02135 [Kiritimatiellaeota bacterium]|nr:hypothetical protein [Kiritimatiellota bacterium]